MPKICLRCNYERKATDSAPDFECPSCHRIYAKMDAANIKQKPIQEQNSVVTPLFHYLFWLGALILLLLGGSQFYRVYFNTEAKTLTKTAEKPASILQIVVALTSKHPLNEKEKFEGQGLDDKINALTGAVTTLSNGQGMVASQSERNAALVALAQGNVTPAKALFNKAESAEALRNLGAFASLDNTQEALEIYRHATQLEPNNADGWIQLGYLLSRTGDVTGAIAAYNNVLALGEGSDNQQGLSAAYGNLMQIYREQGDAGKGSEFFKKTSVINESLGGTAGLMTTNSSESASWDNAIAYAQRILAIRENLGKEIVEAEAQVAEEYSRLAAACQIYGDLNDAIAFYQKSLTIFESRASLSSNSSHPDDKQKMVNSFGMANIYENLAVIYQTRNEPDKAMAFQKKALAIEESPGWQRLVFNVGMIYQQHDDFDKAIAFHQATLAINERLGNKKAMAEVSILLGYTYYHKIREGTDDLGRQNDMAEAKRYYLMSVELYKQLGDPKAEKLQAELDKLQ